jgi:hypothetical protein
VISDASVSLRAVDGICVLPTPPPASSETATMVESLMLVATNTAALPCPFDSGNTDRPKS